jgi:hypothetical protein
MEGVLKPAMSVKNLIYKAVKLESWQRFVWTSP